MPHVVCSMLGWSAPRNQLHVERRVVGRVGGRVGGAQVIVRHVGVDGRLVENERVQRFAPNLQSSYKIITFAADTCKIAAKLAITDAKHVQAKKGDGQKQKGLSGWPTLTTQNITHWCFESAGYDPNGLQRRDGRAPQWSGAA